MIKVDVFYPKMEEDKFDLDYYCNKHLPMVQQLLGEDCKKISVEKGMSGMTPGSAPLYAVTCHLHFENVDAFQTAFQPHAAVIISDISNFTGVNPVIQISEVIT